MEKKFLHELVIDRQYDSFGQTVVALLAAFVIRKTEGPSRFTFDEKIGEQLYELATDANSSEQLVKAINVLKESVKLIEDCNRIIEIIRAVEQEELRSYLFNDILDVYTVFFKGRKLNRRSYFDNETLRKIIGEDEYYEAIYDPFGAFVLNGPLYSCGTYYGMERDAVSWAVGVLRLEFEGMDSSHFLHCDISSDINHFNRKYDMVYVDIPTDYDYLDELTQREEFSEGNLHASIYKKALDCMTDDGIMLFFERHTPLLCGGNKEISTHVIENERLQSVTMLYVESDEEIQSKNAYLLKIGKEHGTDSIYFEGCGHFDFIPDQIVYMDDTDATVDASDVRDMGYCLLPNVYVMQKMYSRIDSSEWPIRKLNEVMWRAKAELGEESDSGAYFATEDFPASPFDIRVDMDSLHEGCGMKSLSKYTRPVLLVNSKVGEFRRAYVAASKDKPVYTSASEVIGFEVSPDVSIDYLLAFLSSDEFAGQRERLLAKETPLLSLIDYTSLIVPSLKKQNEYVREEMAQKLAKMSIDQVEEAKHKHEEYMRNMRVQKHALGQEMLQIRSKLNRLFNIVEKRSLIDSHVEMSERTGATYGDYRESISQHVDTLSGMIETLSGEMKYGKSESIDLIEFFLEWCNNKTQDNYQWKVAGNWVTRTQNVQQYPQIKIPIEALRQILRNIADNASQYAFTSIDRDDYIIRVEVLVSGGVVTVRVLNNGNPLADSMNKEHLLAYGYGHNSGLGIWEIKKIIDEYGMAMRIIDNKEEEFPFGFEFDFNEQSSILSKRIKLGLNT